MLAATGSLDPASFGPPSRHRPRSGGPHRRRHRQGHHHRRAKSRARGEDDFRRSIYVQVRRSSPLTVLDTFDAPVMVPNCEMRNQHHRRAAVAPADERHLRPRQRARASPTACAAEAPGDARGQTRSAPGACSYGKAADRGRPRPQPRLPRRADRSRSRATTTASSTPKDAPPPDPPLEALASLCQILCSSNRFLYVE